MCSQLPCPGPAGPSGKERRWSPRHFSQLSATQSVPLLKGIPECPACKHHFVCPLHFHSTEEKLAQRGGASSGLTESLGPGLEHRSLAL